MVSLISFVVLGLGFGRVWISETVGRFDEGTREREKKEPSGSKKWEKGKNVSRRRFDCFLLCDE